MRGIALLAAASVRLLAGGSALLAAGCASFYDEVTLNPDGSGTYRLTVFARDSARKEDLPTLRAALRRKAEEIAAAAGFTLTSAEAWRQEDLITFQVEASFASPAVFAHPAFSVSPDAKQWAFVVPREVRFEKGRFAARVLRGSAPPRAHPVRGSMAGHEARFSVYLPGEVEDSNGARLGKSATWRFTLDQLCDHPAEMTAVARSPWPWATLGLGAFLVVGLGALAASLFRRRATSRPGAAR